VISDTDFGTNCSLIEENKLSNTPDKIMAWRVTSWKFTHPLQVANGTMQKQCATNLENRLFLKIKVRFLANDSIFMQDGALCHTIKAMINHF
jgi:hypothetical protein